MEQRRHGPMYRWGDTALLRATTRSVPVAVAEKAAEELDLFGDDVARDGLAWLRRVWGDPQLQHLVAEASPALAGRVEVLVAGRGSVPTRDVRRVVVSVASYLLRWQHRATPFGRFAGVAPACIGTGTAVRWGSRHRTIRGLDGVRLGQLVDDLHGDPVVRPRLPVTANDLVVVRGDRVVAPGPPPAGPEELAAVEVSVRATRPVLAALTAARHPVTLGALADLLTTLFPAATPRRVDDLLGELLGQRLLVSALWPPSTAADPLGYILDVLRRAGVAETPGVTVSLESIELAHRQLHTTTGAATPPLERRSESDGSPAAGGTGLNPLGDVLGNAVIDAVVDTVLDAAVTVAKEVVREARDAATVLLRTTPYPFGYPEWRDYHSRFRARYGVGAVVPVLELVGDSGLGLPAGFLGAAAGRSPRLLTARDEKVLALVQRATTLSPGRSRGESGEVGEIVLTDADVADLASGSGDSTAPVLLPSRVEIAVEVRASSPDAVDRGSFELVVTGTPRPGSSMAGRHAALLPPEAREGLGRSFEAAEPGAVAAQLSFAPRKRRNDTITRVQRLMPHVIGLGEHPAIPSSAPSSAPDDGVGDAATTGVSISIGDLAVTADAVRFRLVRLSTGQIVEPRVLHALEASVHTPGLARFLAEVATARCAVYKGFHFGAAAALPFLPRVRYRRTVLSPARWLLRVADLPSSSVDHEAWEPAWQGWARRWRVPGRVALVEQDRRLPLDLTTRFGRSLLRARLHSARGTVELREAAHPRDLGWIGRAHELLVPLTLDRPITHLGRSPAHPPRSDISSMDVPGPDEPGGSRVLVARLHAHPDRHDEILTAHLPCLIDALGARVELWWFHRHRDLRRLDSDQYLQLSLRLPGPHLPGPCSSPPRWGAVAEEVTGWAEAMQRVGLVSEVVLAGHHPQAGRFGHGLAQLAAQRFFAADTTAVLAQIGLSARAAIPPQALAAATMVDVAVGLAGTTLGGLDHLVRALPREQGLLDPTLRTAALGLADPDRAWARLRALPGSDVLLAAWNHRAAALESYRQVLREQRDPLQVARSLLHLHHLRALPVERDAERVTLRLARLCALRQLHIRPGAPTAVGAPS